MMTMSFRTQSRIELIWQGRRARRDLSPVIRTEWMRVQGKKGHLIVQSDPRRVILSCLSLFFPLLIKWKKGEDGNESSAGRGSRKKVSRTQSGQTVTRRARIMKGRKWDEEEKFSLLLMSFFFFIVPPFVLCFFCVREDMKKYLWKSELLLRRNAFAFILVTLYPNVS